LFHITSPNDTFTLTYFTETLEETDHVRIASGTAASKPQEHKPLTPLDRKEGVTITELPLDEQVTVTEQSLAIVTQPMEEQVETSQREEQEEEEEEEEEELMCKRSTTPIF